MSFTESLEEIIRRNPNGLLSSHPTWVRVPLGFVFAVENGFPFESKHFNSSGKGMPLLRIRDVVRGSTETHYSGKFDPEFVVRPGEIVVGMDGDFKCRVWRGVPALLNQRVCRLRPHSDWYLTGLLPHVLQGYLDAINAKTSAITVKHLSSRTIEDLPLPLPPRGEQRRIVEAIETCLTRLDDAIGSLAQVQAKLKAYRASVLKAAVEGRLVPTEASLARAEERDYETAGTLTARVLKERRRRWEEAELARLTAAGKTPKDEKRKVKYKEPVGPDTSALPELPEGWCWANLGQLLHLIRNGQSMAPRAETGVRTLRISGVRPLAVDFQDVRYLPGEPLDYQDDLVEVGDLLFTRYNGTPSLVGVCGRVRVLTEPTVHPDKLIKVRLCSDLHVPYIELAANVGESRGFVERRTRTTAGQAGISGSDLKQMPIPLPPLSEQVRIGDEVERLISVADETRAALVLDERRCARLRQSILKWAFEGKLVDQDPTDEPAEHLLTRILGDRIPAAPIKKGRGHSVRGTA